jgi:hypothetical protein
VNITMSPSTGLAAFGALLLLTGILGGGFEVKELRIPRVGLFSRLLAGTVGLGFIVWGLAIPDAATAIPSTPVAVRSTADPTAIPSTPIAVGPTAGPTTPPRQAPIAAATTGPSQAAKPIAVPPRSFHAGGRWNFQYVVVENTCGVGPRPGEPNPVQLLLNEARDGDGYASDGESVAVFDGDGSSLGTYVLRWPVLQFDIPLQRLRGSDQTPGYVSFYTEFFNAQEGWSRYEIHVATPGGECVIASEEPRRTGSVIR